MALGWTTERSERWERRSSDELTITYEDSLIFERKQPQRANVTVHIIKVDMENILEERGRERKGERKEGKQIFY